ncbi:D-alanyl-D-alanine carboxypeptidase [Streptomyces sp. NPDC051041]|uniref:D-alanyl-D-alanine carboxypeptidase n=1 Tax=Streptomyces sp. NPDC051041 TaxID=3365640 RepID=UPI0037903EC1
MEEASVAGESPDSSKQRESSAQPTSGSAGPVPEARTEESGTAERRDPRLAVARETATTTHGGVDTATRVLSVREVAPEAGEDEDARDAGADGGAEDTGSGSGRAEGSGSPGSGASGASGDREETARGGEKAAEAAQEAREAQEARDGGAEGPEGVTGRTEAESGDAPAADGTEHGADTARKAGESGRNGESGRSGAGSGTRADDAPEAGGDDRDGSHGTPEPGGAPESDDTPGTGADGEDGDGGPAAKSSGASGADEKAVDRPTAVFKAVRPSGSGVDQPTTMLKVGGAAGKAGRAAGGKPAGGAAEDAREAPAEDTGKAPGRPAEKASGRTAGREAGRTAEQEAERTSRFVALKPLEDPSTRKPRPGDATTAPPAVPPADATAPVPQVGPERTTQQPLPPKPPLDLLAELTNTPPPPPTPLRTLARRVKIWTPLVLLLLIVFAVVQTVRPLPEPTLQLTAGSTYTFEGGAVDIPWPSDGQAALDVQGIGSFGSSGAQEPVPIASVAKVMTAYLILRDHPLKSGAEGPKIKIDQAAEDQSDAGPESTVNVFAGDSITQREALEGILIASANNVARLLARWDAGSEKAFVQKMNDAAEDLGMTNTTYTDPSGLNNTTVSTAVDQVKLAKAAMEQPVFREVAAMMSYVDYKGEPHDNWNRLVGFNDVVGIKTGTTTSALGNLVFAAKKEIGGETRRIVGAVVRQPEGGADNTILGGALDAGDKLIRAAQDALATATILKKGDVVGYVDDGLGNHTPVVAAQDVTAVGWAGLKVELTFAADDLPHTAEAGTKVGTLTVGDGGDSGAVRVPVALQRDLAEPGWTDKLTRLG